MLKEFSTLQLAVATFSFFVVAAVAWRVRRKKSDQTGTGGRGGKDPLR